MQGDLYATKGSEYLIVIVYLLLLVGLAWTIALPRFRRLAPEGARPRSRGPIPWFTVADGYGFHQGHGWVGPADAGVVKVGIDDFAAKLLGEPDFFELPAVGEDVRQGGPGWTVRAAPRRLPMLSPVEGEVIAVNPAVARAPRLATHDPYVEGWLFEVRVAEKSGWRHSLLSGELASTWMVQTAERLRRMTAGGLGVVMPDGGTPVRGFARALDQEQWEAVARDFFFVG